MGLEYAPDEEKTPVDPQARKPTLDMLLEKMDEVRADTKLAVAEAREAKGHSQNTYNLQLELNESVKVVKTENEQLARRVRVLEAVRLWPAAVALAALVIAVLALLRTP